jgi:hypothetical protein
VGGPARPLRGARVGGRPESAAPRRAVDEWTGLVLPTRRCRASWPTPSRARSTPSPAEESRLASAPRINPEAYDAYLRGRYFFNRPSDEGLQKAIARFEEAIALALVHLGLGDHARALSELERAHATDSEWLGWLGLDRTFDPLRSEPRFAALVRKVGLGGVRGERR